jgi:hypothetical protein
MSNQTYTVTLGNGSVAVLRHLLNQPSWTKTIGDFITAGQLLAQVVPEPPEQPERPHPVVPNYREALDTWKSESEKWTKGGAHVFTVTEKQRDNIKQCLKAAVEKQTAVPSKPAFDLFTAFGITE